MKRKSLFRPPADDRSLSYDYCMVFSLKEEPKNSKNFVQTKDAQYIVAKLKDQGFSVFCYNSIQGDELMVLITANVIFFFLIIFVLTARIKKI
jgi:hypothetical protein